MVFVFLLAGLYPRSRRSLRKQGEAPFFARRSINLRNEMKEVAKAGCLL